MALINCSECEKQISDKATSCPGCGCPLSDTVKPTTVKFEDLNNTNNAKIDKAQTEIPEDEIDNLCRGCGKLVLDNYLIKCKSCGILGPLSGNEIFKKENLLLNAINKQLNNKDDNEKLKIAINMYKYIIDFYGKVDETYFALSNLQLLHDDNRTPNNLKFQISEILTENKGKIKYIDHYRSYDSSYTCKKCSSTNKLINMSKNIILCINCKTSYELRSNNNANASKNTPEIPVGLYIATSIIGFPIGAGFATGFYFKQKNLLEKGEYEKLKDSITGAKVICIGYSVAILAICIVFFTRLKYLFY